MDTGNRQHLQDIYSSDRTAKDDFTPQVSKAALEERKRDIRRHQLTSFVLGSSVLILLLALIYVIANEYIVNYSVAPSPTPVAQSYIPRYSLSGESQWVFDFARNYGSPKWNGEGDRPLSSKWVRKAAYNLILAEQAAEIGKNQAAAGYYEDALEILPDLEGVKVPLGMVYFKLEAFDKALALLEDASEVDLTPNVLNNLGVACLAAKAYDRAETYLNQAILEEPSYAEAQKNMAELYKAQDRDDEAVAAYEKYVDLRPMDIDTQHSLALYLTKLGKWEQAATLLDRLTTEITDVSVLYFLQARAETKIGHPQKAMEALRRGIQLSDPNAALAWMNDAEFETLRNTDDFQNMMEALESL